jgi:hypothetical protein
MLMVVLVGSGFTMDFQNKETEMDTLQLVFGVLKLLEKKHGSRILFTLYSSPIDEMSDYHVSGEFYYTTPHDDDTVLHEFNSLEGLQSIISLYFK